MIRNVVLIKLKDEVGPDQVNALISALGKMEIDGMRRMTIGRDLGLRDGNYDLAIVNDFEDEEAYHAYDKDPEHNRIRREMTAPMAENVKRVQFTLG